jgi:hypothetical protein
MLTTTDDPVRQWTSADLADLAPGTNAYAWRTKIGPRLAAMGALRRDGRRWFGRRSDIEAALLGRFKALGAETTEAETTKAG